MRVAAWCARASRQHLDGVEEGEQPVERGADRDVRRDAHCDRAVVPDAVAAEPVDDELWTARARTLVTPPPHARRRQAMETNKTNDKTKRKETTDDNPTTNKPTTARAWQTTNQTQTNRRTDEQTSRRLGADEQTN